MEKHQTLNISVFHRYTLGNGYQLKNFVVHYWGVKVIDLLWGRKTIWKKFGYGLFKEHRNWPLVIANSPGIIFGLTAAITARL